MKISMRITVSSLPLSLNTLSTIYLKKFFKKTTISSKNPTKYTTHSAIFPAHGLIEIPSQES